MPLVVTGTVTKKLKEHIISKPSYFSNIRLSRKDSEKKHFLPITCLSKPISFQISCAPLHLLYKNGLYIPFLELAPADGASLSALPTVLRLQQDGII